MLSETNRIINPFTNQVVVSVQVERPQQYSFVARREDSIWAVSGSTNDVVCIELQRE
jgi:hypothetical protein